MTFDPSQRPAEAPVPIPPSAAHGHRSSTLAGARVLVVGGSSGIGRAAAELLVLDGAEVVLTAREDARAAQVAAQIAAETPDRRGSVQGAAVDVTDPDSVQALFAGLGALDHVLVTAAVLAVGPVTGPEAATELNGESRVLGGHRLVRACLPQLRGGGSITLTSGLYATRPVPGSALAAASLGAVEAMTRALALELAPVRVNCLRPGSTDTPLLRRFVDADPDGGLTAAFRHVPLGRVGTAAEVAAGAVFLMSNTYVTGSVLTVDGGAGLA